MTCTDTKSQELIFASSGASKTCGFFYLLSLLLPLPLPKREGFIFWSICKAPASSAALLISPCDLSASPRIGTSYDPSIPIQALVTTMALHNGLQSKIWSGVIELGTFTVSELCEHIGLERDSVYDTLSKLSKENFLTKQSLPIENPEGKKARHRPVTLYSITQDPQKRRELADKLAEFAPAKRVSIPGLGVAAIARADDALNEISVQIAELAKKPISHQEDRNTVCTEANELLSRLALVRDDLELAFYEAGSSHHLELTAKRWKLHKAEVEQTLKEAEDLSNSIQAQEILTKELSRFFDVVKADSSWPFNKVQTLRDQLYAHVDDAISSTELKDRLFQIHGRWLGSLTTILATENKSESRNKVIGLLTRAAIGSSTDPHLVLDYMSLYTSNAGNRHKDCKRYNLLNVEVLAGKREHAKNSWIEWTKGRVHDHTFQFLEYEYPRYSNVAFAQVPSNAVITENLSQLRKHLEEGQGTFSMISLNPLEGKGRVVTPNLLDPLEHLGSIELADSLRQDQPDLVVYGSLEDRMQLPGLPLVRLATVLFSVGIEPIEAWNAAEALEPDQTLIVCQSSQKKDFCSNENLQKLFRVREERLKAG
jgi:hypothetical protein